MGRPVIPVEWCSTLGTAGDIVLADLRHYQRVPVRCLKSGSDQERPIHEESNRLKLEKSRLPMVDG